MPKKASRSAPRSKSRPRRPPPPRSQPTTPEDGTVRSAVATVEPEIAPPPRTAPTRRTASSLRRTPAITINYDYLRRDIRAVAVLAPSMVILVIVAYLVLH